MAEDYMKVRSVESPGRNSRGSSKMGYGGYEPYGWNTDKYQRMPKGEIKALKDNTQASSVYDIRTDTEKYDLGRMRYDSVGMKGYSKQAFDYDY